MFGISGFELVIILVFALFIFGPDKLPEVGKSIGKGLKMLNKAKNDLQATVTTDILRPEDMKTMRELQDDFNQLSSTVKNPMNLLNTSTKQTAQKITDEINQTVKAGSAFTPAETKASESAGAEEPAVAGDAQSRPEDGPEGERLEQPVDAPKSQPQPQTEAQAQPAPAAEPKPQPEPAPEPEPEPEEQAGRIRTIAEDIWEATSDSPEADTH